MKTTMLSLFFLLPLLLLAQKTTDQRIIFGIAQSHLHLTTTDHYETYSSNSRSTSIRSETNNSRGLGFNLGYSRTVHPRWELTTRINYAGNKVQDTIHYYYRLPTTTLPDTRTRSYRAFWSEAMVFWRMIGDRSLADLQLGTGIAHLYYRQEYSSGYVYNLDFDQFDVKYHTIERKGSFGIPIHLQFQYPINYNWKVGFAAQFNSFFDGNKQSGVTAFAAYRW
ncbi:MAG: hypothetical protein ACRBG0_16890 [Lewinella sp.]|jgi:hypothetical protein|uniref:hypothetical protein n=1 Tax=Lewinella sp. TaxID=2004506 RepID=UPI003D6A1D62